MRMELDLIRLENSEQGTFGVLRMDGKVFCVTLEPPDRDNARNVSRIPAGRYVCNRVRSPRFGETYEVADVPGRTHILFHPGNVDEDTRGCVLLGNHFGLLRGDRAVLNSGRTFARFLEAAAEAPRLNLTIEERCEEDSWNTSV